MNFLILLNPHKSRTRIISAREWVLKRMDLFEDENDVICSVISDTIWLIQVTRTSGHTKTICGSNLNNCYCLWCRYSNTEYIAFEEPEISQIHNSIMVVKQKTSSEWNMIGTSINGLVVVSSLEDAFKKLS